MMDGLLYINFIHFKGTFPAYILILIFSLFLKIVIWICCFQKIILVILCGKAFLCICHASLFSYQYKVCIFVYV
mgnify:CR=1 FL=1